MKRIDHRRVSQLVTVLRVHRELTGIPRSKLAKAAGVTYHGIEKLEKGKHVPSLGLFCAVAHALGLRVTIKASNETVGALVAAGFNDCQIGRLLGVDHTTVLSRRKKLGIAAASGPREYGLKRKLWAEARAGEARA